MQKHNHLLASTLAVAEIREETNFICFICLVCRKRYTGRTDGLPRQEDHELICLESAEADRGLCDSTRTSQLRVWRDRG